MIHLIGISGKLNSGKDTVCDLIRNRSKTPWQKKSFATKLKEIAGLIANVDPSKFEDREFKNSPMDEIWRKSDGSLMTYREFLQKIGTNGLRDNVHENIWVNGLFSEFDEDFRNVSGTRSSRKAYQLYMKGDSGLSKVVRLGPNWIITDVRFPNEGDIIKARGGVVLRINRPSNSESSDHPSETAMDNYDFDYQISNDGTLKDLDHKVQEFLTLINTPTHGITL